MAQDQVTLTYRQGGAIPAPAFYDINGSGFVMTLQMYVEGGNWLVPTLTSATTPSMLTIQVAPTNLSPGAYQGDVQVVSIVGTVYVYVNLIVLPATHVDLEVSPASLMFNYTQSSGILPGSQPINVTSDTSLAVGVSAQPAWLSCATTGFPPFIFNVAVDPIGLPIGTYTTQIVLTSANAVVNLPVTLVVAPHQPLVTGVSNAASYLQAGMLSPGEIVSVFGLALGPTSPISVMLDSTGKVANSSGGVQVLIGGVPAPLTYVSSTQINAVVPYEISSVRNPSLQVIYNSQSSNTIATTAVASSPGIFATGGSGQAAILNQDGSVNDALHPEPTGGIITVYMTGGGEISPTAATGSITCSNSCSTIPAPILPVSANVNNQLAEILWYGEAPMMVSGVLQVNIRIPAATTSGVAKLSVSVGGNSSQPGVTLYVR